jgi:hypothetical protein
MTMSAFRGDVAVRNEALKRLDDHVQARHIVDGSLFWDGTKGSVSGCLLETSNPAVWESKIGIGRWLAYLLDALTGRLNPARGFAETSALLESIPLGLDTTSMGNRLICRLLGEVTSKGSTSGSASAGAGAFPGELNEIHELVVSLHQRRAAGEAVAPAEWRQARRAAMAATDARAPIAADGERLDSEREHLRAVGGMIEAAAWDPQVSGTAVAEVLRLWLSLEDMKADEEFGWTRNDHDQIGNLLNEMHLNYIEPNPAEERDVYILLEEHHPDAATRLRAYIQHGKDHSAICAERACVLLRRLVEATA